MIHKKVVTVFCILAVLLITITVGCTSTPTTAPTVAVAPETTEAPAPTTAPVKVEPTKAPAVAPVVTEAPAETTAPEETGLIIPTEKDEITIALGTAFDHVASFAGVEKGIWDKYGFDVKFRIVPTGVDQIAAMQAGEAVFMQGGITPITSAVLKGVPIRVLGFLQGAAFQEKWDPDMAIVATEKSGIKTPADLKGKRIGVPVGTTAYEYLVKVLQNNGMTVDDVTIMNIKDADLRTAFETNNVDAISCWEAYPSTILVKVPGAVLVQRDGGIISRYGNVATLQKTIDENPDMVYRYLVAFSEAEQWVREHPDEAGIIATRWIGGLDPDIARAVARNLAYDPRVSEFGIMGWENTLKFMLESGAISDTLDVRALFAPEFMLKVMEEFPELFSDLPPIPEDKLYKVD